MPSTYPALVVPDGVPVKFDKVECRDRWYLHIRDPQHTLYNVSLAMKELEPVEMPAELGDCCRECGVALA